MPTRDPSLPPLKVFIFLAPDCSGSTAFGDFLRSMHEDNHPNRSFLNNHKYDAEDDEGWVDGMILNQEWLKEKKNPFKTESNTWANAAELTLKYHSNNNSHFAILNLHRFKNFDQEVADVFHRWGATAAVLTRTNALDRTICR